MSRQARRLALGTALALAIWLLAGAGANVLADEEDDKQIKLAQADVVELVKALEKGGKVDAAAVKAVFEKGGKKKYEELNHIMYIYKSSNRKGLAVFTPKGPSDGIEAKLNKLATLPRPMKAPAIKKMAPELLKATHVNLVMYEVTRLYTPTKDAKKWNQHNEDMKKATEALIKATKEANGEELKKAIEDVNSSCVNCHADFRKNN
jgi:hypothetical protein